MRRIKNNQQSLLASVSSAHSSRTLILKVKTLITTMSMIILIIISFYGGVIYAHNQQRQFPTSNLQALHKFAIGLVIYTDKGSITINNEYTNKTQAFKINAKTIISINGARASSNLLKPGEIVLIRLARNNQSTAGIIIANSHFTD